MEHRFTDWPEIRQIFHIVRRREYRGRTSEVHVYGITSLTQEEAGAERLLNLNRNHWHMENRLHHMRDMTFRKDQSMVRHREKARILCAARNTVKALASLAGFSNDMEAIETFSEHRTIALRLITLKRTE